MRRAHLGILLRCELQNHRMMDHSVQKSEDATLAARNALRAMIDYLQQRGFNRQQASLGRRLASNIVLTEQCVFTTAGAPSPCPRRRSHVNTEPEAAPEASVTRRGKSAAPTEKKAIGAAF